MADATIKETGCVADVPPVISLLAEHLDQVLAAGEDLTDLSYATASEPSSNAPTINEFVRDLERLELAVAIRTLRAREHTDVLKHTDSRFRVMADLFLSGTALIADLYENAAETERLAFEAGSDPIAYLQSRGVVPVDSGTLPRGRTTEVDETFRIVGVVEIGPLMDLVAAFLDAIEMHYEVFPNNGAPLRPESVRKDSLRARLAA